MPEQIDSFERDGWTITVEVEQDYDYRPGQDDDVYPRLEPADRYDEDEPRDYYTGQFEKRPILVDDGRDYWKVTPDEIARLIEVGGMNPRRARKIIESDARAIVRQDLSWVGVIVTASRGSVSGDTSLWGIDYDTRDARSRKVSDEYLREVADDLTSEAIDAAAREVLGGLAPLALSY